MPLGFGGKLITTEVILEKILVPTHFELKLWICGKEYWLFSSGKKRGPVV